MKYDVMAPMYDRLMSHVEYADWLNLIERVITRFGSTPFPVIFEIGGGTGVLGSKLMRRGFQYICSDYSDAMCHEASKKSITTFCADGRSLPVKTTFDLVIFLYDGINYLLTPQEYTKLFNEVARCLPLGGLFLFDITTETNSLRHFTEYYDFEDWGDYSYIRHSYYDKQATMQYNDFTIFKQVQSNPSLYQKHFEHHKQRLFPVQLLIESIPRSYFRIEGIWDGFSFRKYTKYSERIHFLLKRIDRV
jgi:SAM-dependent methyltransferase